MLSEKARVAHSWQATGSDLKVIAKYLGVLLGSALAEVIAEKGEIRQLSRAAAMTRRPWLLAWATPTQLSCAPSDLSSPTQEVASPSLVF